MKPYDPVSRVGNEVFFWNVTERFKGSIQLFSCRNFSRLGLAISTSKKAELIRKNLREVQTRNIIKGSLLPQLPWSIYDRKIVVYAQEHRGTQACHHDQVCDDGMSLEKIVSSDVGGSRGGNQAAAACCQKHIHLSQKDFLLNST